MKIELLIELNDYVDYEKLHEYFMEVEKNEKL